MSTERQTVWLEPAKEGGKVRWTGIGRTLSRAIAQGIFRALQDGAGKHAVISRRTQRELEEVIETLPEAGNTAVPVIEKNESSTARLWTFGGTRANRTMAKQIHSVAEVRRIDALGLDLKTPVDPKVLNADFLSLTFSFHRTKSRSAQSR